MAKAKKLPSGNWRVQAKATIDGKQVVRSFTATTAGAAELAAKEWQVKNKTIQNNSAEMTVSEAIDEYIEIKENVLSPSTIRGYITIKNNSLDGIKSIKLQNLTRTILQKYINDLSKNKSPKTVYNAYGLITAIMAQFAPEIKIDKITLPQRQLSNKRALTQSETALFLNAIEGHRNEIPFLLALWLGLRQSEILGLDWSDIDLENNTLYIHSAMVPDKNNKYVQKPTTKNISSTRHLPIPAYIKSKLDAVPDKTGKLYKYSPSVLGKDLKKIMTDLDIHGVSLHDLRRTMATIGVTLNIADKVMMERGGWKNPQTMKKFTKQS